jgi:N-acetylmuramoyl-L-alanine amidase
MGWMGWVERITAIVAGVAVVSAVSLVVARSEDAPERSAVPVVMSTPTAPPPTPPPTVTPTRRPEPPPPPVLATTVGALRTTGITTVRAHATFASTGVQLLTPGVLLPVYERRGDFYKVFTPNEVFGWVHVSKATTYPRATGSAKSLAQATIVLDPGHGGHLPGAKGPTGLPEKTPNLDIARRVAEELSVARVFLTRGEGHAGLAYRSALANRLGAQAFVSLHNNALPDRVNSKTPGSETYYQQRSKGSKRLSGLIYEELAKALVRYKILWGRDPFAGAKYRRGSGGHDYYAVLRRTLVPAVIVEGMFISNAPEEALLRRGDVKEIYAEAVARGIKRYFDTDDAGSGYKDPYAKPTPQCRIQGCFEYRK